MERMILGLTSSDAAQLLKEHGENAIEEHASESIFIKFFKQFNNYLTLLLMGAGVLSFFMGEAIDGGLILGIVILNALFGLYQEAKAEGAIAALRTMSITKVRVHRDGTEIEIDSRYLVPGDIIFLEEGMKVPADATVFESRVLEVNEAALTGESLAIHKAKNDELFMGTIVAKGRGLAQVTLTGMKTKFGHIAQSLKDVTELKTPLQQKLEKLTQIIGAIGLLASAAVFTISLVQGSSYFSSFLLAISLAVAIVPEGLPTVMTLTLSIGVGEMARKKAIVRKLSAIEALGSVTLIATDKTGTLTTNKMRVKHIYVDGKEYDVQKPPPLTNKTFERILVDGILCSTATLIPHHSQNTFDVLGDPTEGAGLILAHKLGLLHEEVRSSWKLVDEIPFDSTTRLMQVSVQKKREFFRFIKGAPESVLAQCSHMELRGKKVALTTERKRVVEKQLVHWAKSGYRVLGFAYAQKSGKPIFLGMLSLHDPPRPEVKEALEHTHTAGIRVVMVTGDNPQTAQAIGTSIGLLRKGEDIITGAELDEHTDAELLPLLPKIRIFARTSPFQKHRIVKLYQQLGEVVAVTGDGVNDAIAIKQSDVGIAMGITGTDVARETADMVLTDDNFATIVSAIEEGRNIIKNLKNAIKYLLACNIAEAMALFIGLFLGYAHILYPIQLLYINLVTDGLPALALAFSPKHGNIMKVPPAQNINLFARKEQQYVFGVGLVTAILVIAALYVFKSATNELLGTTAAFSVLALIQSFILIDLWLHHRFILTHLKSLFKTPFIIGFIFPFITQWVILSIPQLAVLFKITPVTFMQYLEFTALAALILVGIELVKKLTAIRAHS